ncbi:hypothetical protein PENTCL1PPCAC_1356, partial [Pristionchus entomophagus]
DLSCCDVFLYDFTDPHKRCYHACQYHLQTPALPSKEKLHNIKKCRRKNYLSNCFNLCRVEMNEHTAKGLTNFKWREPDRCSRAKMTDDGEYPLKEEDFRV